MTLIYIAVDGGDNYEAVASFLPLTVSFVAAGGAGVVRLPEIVSD